MHANIRPAQTGLLDTIHRRPDNVIRCFETWSDQNLPCPAGGDGGLDPDPKALEVCRRKAAKAGVEVQWDRGFSQELPYDEACFDRVLSSGMLHHLDHEAKLETFREVARVLRSGGRFHAVEVRSCTSPARPLLMS